MVIELSVVIKTDKFDNESTPALQGRCVRCLKTKFNCKKCGVKLDQYKGTVCLMRTMTTCKYVYE